jgi:DNA modification methylase
MTQEQKRQLVADQLRETAERSNRWVGKQLGVSHPTVASVRSEMEATGKLIQLTKTLGNDGKYRPAYRELPIIHRPPAERQTRISGTTLIWEDCQEEMRKLASRSIDAIITDPIYPCVDREYGRMLEQDWHAMMHVVVSEARRVLKPTGSMVVILQPNSEKVGKMRLWLWDFVAWAGREWNLLQDAWWWAVDAVPLGGIKRHQGLMRPSVKMCVWLGSPDCYRNQDKVLWTPFDKLSAMHRSDIALRTSRSGKTYRNSTIARAADERGGTTPFNLLPIPVGGNPGAGHQHPAVTPYDVAAWWCRYILPVGGLLCDPFCGSGTMLLAGLGHAASKVIGIERVPKYLRLARKRIEER